MHANSSSLKTSSTTIQNSDSTSNNVDSLIVQDELISSTSIVSDIPTALSLNSAPTSEVPSKISFSVSRREKSRVVVSKNKLSGVEQDREDEEHDDEEEKLSRKRTILSLEDGIVVDNELHSKKEKKVFIIPVLRLSTQSQIERLQKLAADGKASEEDLARLSILLGTIGNFEQNGNEVERKGRIDLPSNQTQSTGPTVAVADDADPDYNSIPVGEFGLAFLRGCGWKDEQSCIGRSNAQAVPLRVSKPRPKGLGLGAVLPSTAPPTVAGSSKNASENKGKEDEILGKQSYVKCLRGIHRGALGQVRSIDEENASVFVELAWPPGSVGRTVRVSQLAVELVPRLEFRERLKAAARGEDEDMENGHRRGRVKV